LLKTRRILRAMLVRRNEAHNRSDLAQRLNSDWFDAAIQKGNRLQRTVDMVISMYTKVLYPTVQYFITQYKSTGLYCTVYFFSGGNRRQRTVDMVSMYSKVLYPAVSVPSYTVLVYSPVLYYAVLCCTVLCCEVLRCAALCCTVLYCAVLTALHHTVLIVPLSF